MAINAAFTARTTDGVSSGYAMEGDTAVVLIHNDSVMAGAEVSIEACSADTNGKYVAIDHLGLMTQPGCRTVTLKTGMYLRVRAAKGGASMSLNVDIIG